AVRPGAGPRVARRKRPSIAAIAASLAFVVLAVLAWYALTARSVSLEFTPEPEVVELPDTLFKVRVADRFMLRPGKYRVTAQLTGYYPLGTEIEVGLLHDQRFEFLLTKLPDQVELVTLPEAGA